MRGRFHHRKGCGGRESGVELEIQESSTGQRELSSAKFGSYLEEALLHSVFASFTGHKSEVWLRLEI